MHAPLYEGYIQQMLKKSNQKSKNKITTKKASLKKPKYIYDNASETNTYICTLYIHNKKQAYLFLNFSNHPLLASKFSSRKSCANLAALVFRISPLSGMFDARIWANHFDMASSALPNFNFLWRTTTLAWLRSINLVLLLTMLHAVATPNFSATNFIFSLPSTAAINFSFWVMSKLLYFIVNKWQSKRKTRPIHIICTSNLTFQNHVLVYSKNSSRELKKTLNYGSLN